jgi:hypothetical protein
MAAAAIAADASSERIAERRIKLAAPPTKAIPKPSAVSWLPSGSVAGKAISPLGKPIEHADGERMVNVKKSFPTDTRNIEKNEPVPPDIPG